MARQKLLQCTMLLAIAVTLLVSCGLRQAQPTAAPVATAPPIVIVVTSPPTPTPNLTGNDTGKTIISRANQDMGFRTTYMIISKSGTVIVADPYRILDGIKADTITSSHTAGCG